MALIGCPECGKEVSDQAISCPACGYPIEKYVKEQAKLLKKAKRLTVKKIDGKEEFTDEELKEALDNRKEEAEEYVKDPEKFERFVERLEKKLKKIPKFGEYASDIACMISLIRSYIKKEYTDIPIGSIVGITSALVYIVTPWDLIPDAVPVIGYADDLAVIMFALRMVHTDIEEYKVWRKEKGRQIVN
ncbi:MAG: DUF1232 domain-containing protein [Clostridiaceae bacterium]|nr:DUF1232 domain-containing protein [Clostridiaceae bacterium]